MRKQKYCFSSGEIYVKRSLFGMYDKIVICCYDEMIIKKIMAFTVEINDLYISFTMYTKNIEGKYVCEFKYLKGCCCEDHIMKFFNSFIS